MQPPLEFHVFVIFLITVVAVTATTGGYGQDEVFRGFGTLHTMEKLVFWANKEEEIVKELEERLFILQREKDLIDTYIKDYEESSGNALKNAIKPVNTSIERGRLIGSSAVLGHRMTYRYVTVTKNLREFLQSSSHLDSEDKINQVLNVDDASITNNDILFWPNEDDLHISHVAILHMHELYGFWPSQFYQGLTPDTKYGGALEAIHCALIGETALSLGYYSITIEWLELAKTLLTLHSSDKSISESLVDSLLNVAVEMHNLKFRTDRSNYMTYFNTFMQPTYKGQPTHERRRGRTSVFHKYSMKYGNGTSPEINMLALCSGREFQPIEIRSRLRCFHNNKVHPYFILNPLKVEQLSEYPNIVQIYEVLGDYIINMVYKDRGVMELSNVATPDSNPVKVHARTSSGSELHEGSKLQEVMDKKTRMISGLEFHSDEDRLQVTEYIYGRLYRNHVDPLLTFEVNGEDTIKTFGDRVATVLYYLEEPTFGGVTPFCEVGISVKPVRGSAVFWINMYRNGTARTDISHGACPILHGSKIVLQQWIRYNRNFQTFKCSLDPNQ